MIKGFPVQRMQDSVKSTCMSKTFTQIYTETKQSEMFFFYSTYFTCKELCNKLFDTNFAETN